MRANFLLILLSWLFVTSFALPSPSSKTSLIEKRTPGWQFYYDVTASTHQTNFLKWSGLGYRMISLSVYGQPPNNKYAAVWVLRTGPSWYATHQASASSYQAFFDSHSPNGYVTTMVTATGPANAPVFAGVMEQNGVTDWYQKCNIAGSQAFKTEINNGNNDRYYLKSFTEYGSSNNRLYCGVWYHNDQFDKYSAFLDQSFSEFPPAMIAETSKPKWRPYMFAVSEDDFVSVAFTDTDVGTWVSKHDLTAAQLQTEYTNQKAVGRYVIHLQGGGTGANTLFSVIFADYDVPTPRTWRVAGSATGFQNNAAAGAAADTMMQDFMKANGVRQAQLSIGKSGNIIMEKAYSWSESTRHTTQVDDVFLLADLSKAFLEAAVQTLYNSGKLTPSTFVYPMLGYTSTIDARCQQITVNHLLTHYGGFDAAASGFDVAYQSTVVAQANQAVAPATLKQTVDYMSNYVLDFSPGAKYAYSNYGYILLSYLIEHVTGKSYFDYLSSSVLVPGGYDVRKWGTAANLHTSDLVTQESMLTGMSALTPWSWDLSAAVFGGDDMVKEVCFGSAALTASASTLATFISTHAVWGIGGRPTFPGRGLQVKSRSGSTPGSSTFMQSRNDGTDWAVTVNTRDWPAGSNPFDDVLTGVTIPAFLAANPSV